MSNSCGAAGSFQTPGTWNGFELCLGELGKALTLQKPEPTKIAQRVNVQTSDRVPSGRKSAVASEVVAEVLWLESLDNWQPQR